MLHIHNKKGIYTHFFNVRALDAKQRISLIPLIFDNSKYNVGLSVLSLEFVGAFYTMHLL